MSRYFLENTYYLITVPTINHYPFFGSGKKKNIILNRIKSAKQKFGLVNFDYGIMSSHYHLFSLFNDGKIIPDMLNAINGGSSFDYNREFNHEGSIWDEYHIWIANCEEAIYKCRGYTIGNPYKHNEVKSIEELLDYPYSSFKEVVNKYDLNHAREMVNSVIELNKGDLLIDEISINNQSKRPA